MSQWQSYQLDKTCKTDRQTNGKWVVDLLFSAVLQIADLAQKMAKTLCKSEKNSNMHGNIFNKEKWWLLMRILEGYLWVSSLLSSLPLFPICMLLPELLRWCGVWRLWWDWAGLFRRKSRRPGPAANGHGNLQPKRGQESFLLCFQFDQNNHSGSWNGVASHSRHSYFHLQSLCCLDSLVTSIMSHFPFSQFYTALRYISVGGAPSPLTCGLAYVGFKTSFAVEAASALSGNITGCFLCKNSHLFIVSESYLVCREDGRLQGRPEALHIVCGVIDRKHNIF